MKTSKIILLRLSALAMLLTLIALAIPKADAQNTFPATGFAGIGTTSPDAALTILNDDVSFATGNLRLSAYAGTNPGAADNYVGQVRFEKYRGTVAAPLKAEDGDRVAGFLAAAYDGNNIQRSAVFGFRVDGPTSTGNMPIGFFVQTGDASSNKPERMLVNSSGQVQIVDLAGTGDRMVVADATGFLSTQPIPTGGGGGGVLNDLTDVTLSTPANNDALGYNGTEWANRPNDWGETNELQVLTQTGNMVTLSGGGGVVNIDDADADPANEIQVLSLMGNTLALSGDPTTVDLSGYLDNTDAQALSWNAGTNELSISGGNTVILPGGSGGSDSDWVQTAGVIYNASDKVLVGTNTPIDSRMLIENTDQKHGLYNLHNSSYSGLVTTGFYNKVYQNNNNFTYGTINRIEKSATNNNWLYGTCNYFSGPGSTGGNVAGSRNHFESSLQGTGNTIYGYYVDFGSAPADNEYSFYAVKGNAYFGDKVGVGKTVPSAALDVMYETSADLAAIRGEGKNGPTNGYLGVQGYDNFDGNTSLDIAGLEIGAMGVSTGNSASDNVGVYGFSNDQAGYFEHSVNTNSASLANDIWAGEFIGDVTTDKLVTELLHSDEGVQIMIDRNNNTATSEYFRVSRGGDAFPLMQIKDDRTAFIYGPLGIGNLVPSAVLDVSQIGTGDLARFRSGGSTDFLINDIGQVAINTASPATGYELSVNGEIICEEILVKDSGSWPDYVFEDNYTLIALSELERRITSSGHLPGIPSAKEIEENGVLLGDMQKRLLEKVEELTLYTIEQGKQIEGLKKKVEALETENTILQQK